MKGFLLLIIVLMGFLEIAAQKPTQSANKSSEERIVVELYLLDEYPVRDNGTPIPNNEFEIVNESKDFEMPIGGSFATVGCINCPLSSEYSFIIPSVEKISDRETKIFFDITFKNKRQCKTSSTVIVKPGKISTFDLKCDIKARLAAYRKSEQAYNR